MLAFKIFDNNLKKIIKFGTPKSINTYLKVKNSTYFLQILTFKYLFIDFTAPN